jgi:transposase
VLDLYQRIFERKRLRPDEYVLCADEKTSIQARARSHRTVAAGPGRPALAEHEYERRGALAYLAALDLHRPRLIGRCEEKSGIEPFDRLVEQVMRAEPYRAAKRVFLIVDNGSAHRGAKSVERLEGRWPNLRLIHLPIHASWLNQIEIYFSILQRKLLQPNDFADLASLERAILDFERYYARIAEPFEWRFTRADLNRLLARIASEQTVPALTTPLTLAA